jgi:pyrophosphatase PpaX
VQVALSRLSATAEEAVFIGDSRHDMECGRAAGVKTAAVLWGPFGRSDFDGLRPDFWLEHPSELDLLAEG